MRRSREDTEETRRQIVRAASRLFREKGISATSVADVMGSLGLTVGGFYRHCSSKEALLEEAIELASLETAKRQVDRHPSRRTEDEGGRRNDRQVLEETLGGYLSEAHRLHPAEGCPVAALCSEVAHE